MMFGQKQFTFVLIKKLTAVNNCWDYFILLKIFVHYTFITHNSFFYFKMKHKDNRVVMLDK